MRYLRQETFAPLGGDGQRRLRSGRVLIVGVGGLGSWTADLLARAGVGFLRLVDDDKVDWTNLHRQSLTDESDAIAARPKVEAAASRIRQINDAVSIEPVAARLGPDNIKELADGVDIILDGTDDFQTRFVINDAAVAGSLPWVFAGVGGAEAQTMTIVPKRSACLRCVYDSPPPPELEAAHKAATVGVLGPAVAAIASIQANEAIKILAGRHERLSTYLIKTDLWKNTVQRIDVSQSRPDCPCCGRGIFQFLAKADR
ncbi:MAG: HesA/MoeB/ThiF family protein [Planctomycetota bacterium]|nr:HesA/MoeB/ThiF family protein [Planctomycetota bacterium]